MPGIRNFVWISKHGELRWIEIYGLWLTGDQLNWIFQLTRARVIILDKSITAANTGFGNLRTANWRTGNMRTLPLFSC